MRNRVIAFVVGIVVVVIAVVGYNVYRQQSRSASQTATNTQPSVQSKQAAKSAPKKAGKILIVYFSRKDGVSDGPLKIGHTKVVADFIQKRTGADEYEIKAAKPYPKSFQATADRAQKEQEDNARPKIKNALPDVKKYDTVFIGAPVWWGEYPMIVRTFMDSVDLNGKHVVPFTTHKGSGMGNAQEQVKQQYPRAKVLEGIGIEGTQAEKSKGKVNQWLSKIGY